MSILLLALVLAQDPVAGDSTIRAQAGKSELVIRTTSRLAGAIDSLRWDDREFINSVDHGRQLQSASNLDAGSPLSDETFNPTEAGSRADQAGPKSSSVLLSLQARDNVLETRTKMAFWLKPGERSGRNPAKNTTIVSEHLLTKKVTIGVRDLAQVVEYVATFTLPAGERHTAATFEAVTGYMPPDFSRFLVYDPQAKTARPLSDGPGEQGNPVILSTENGSHAMGIYSPEPAPSYGRFRFVPEKVVKWNCVFRVTNKEGIPPGDYRYRMYLPVGTLDDVVASLRRLRELFPESR
ncbi:MAG TPA: hypothetical protein VKW04_00735 [Planctomycetota bacterium]|nr:hypothetical protein [Planctomycetota bacterium]